MALKRRAVFLDLNGTLVMPVQPARLDELQVIVGVVPAIARLASHGFLCPIVTVQSRIAKGLFSLDDFHGWFSELATAFADEGAPILGPYVCPHSFPDPCPCEKPKPLLYQLAADEHGIDFSASWVIGDTAADVQVASAVGGRACLVRTGWGHYESNVAAAVELGADVVDSLTEAVDLILRGAPSVNSAVQRTTTHRRTRRCRRL